MIEQQMTIVGNMATDPTKIDTARDLGCRFRVAQNERWRDGEGNWRDGPSLFLDVTCWRGLAGNVMQSVKRGDPVLVAGKLRDSSWTDKHEVRHQRVELVAEYVGLDLRRGRTGGFVRNGKAAAVDTGSDVATSGGWPAEGGSPTAGDQPGEWGQAAQPGWGSSTLTDGDPRAGQAPSPAGDPFAADEAREKADRAAELADAPF